MLTCEELREVDILKGLPTEVLAWLVGRGTRVDLAIGERMVSVGQPAQYMFIVVEGKIQRYEEIGGQWLVVATTRTGEVTGMLPFSRMTHYPGHAVAVEPTRLLRLHKDEFDEMLSVSHELGQRLVAEMSNRVRGDVRLEQQREKMIALGRLSAGLAHELNNPAAAIRRTSGYLAEKLANLSPLMMAVAKRGLKKETASAVEQLCQAACEREPAGRLSALERSDREEELATWLAGRNVEDAWELAGLLGDTGLVVDDLESFAKSVPDDLLHDALAWVMGGVEANRMIDEIRVASEKVSELVNSVKTYSHMDRSTEHKPTDIREGLDNTLAMLGYKLKQKKIRLMRDYPEDLPTVPGNAGELNQVWTYLIDNALDAMKENGRLVIKLESNDWGVMARIIDDGEGIPKDLHSRIFDPFFTTKDVGKGTGLGLNIARRIVHTCGGQIECQSEPGRTEMYVRLPHVAVTNLGSPASQ